MKTPVRITVLSDMAGNTPAQQAAQAARWKLQTLDLKTVMGKNIAEVTGVEAEQLATTMAEHGVGVEGFSTHLFSLTIEEGHAAFESHLAQLDGVLDAARVLQPRVIRLIAAQSNRRREMTDSYASIQREHAWLLPLYARAVERIHAAGFTTVIENETGGSIFGRPEEIISFFDALGRRGQVALTWDVQNLWQLGTYPSLDVYRQLKPYIGYLHLKGGRAGPDGRTLQWRAGLADATWPVLEITRAVIADGLSPAICINPSHGAIHPDYPVDGVYGHDIDFLRRELNGAVI